MTDVRSLCVYCASSPGTNPSITSATIALGQRMAERGVRLIYGGGSVGLMGLIADTVIHGGGAVTGVIPTNLFPREVAHLGLTELIEVDSMHTRKRIMFERADAFLALPGGFGTLEEVAEITTWAQIGLHNKPVGLLNIDGYWNGLVNWLERSVAENLMKADNRELLVVESDVDALLDAFARYDVPRTSKWTELD